MWMLLRQRDQKPPAQPPFWQAPAPPVHHVLLDTLSRCVLSSLLAACSNIPAELLLGLAHTLCQDLPPPKSTL